MYIISQFTVKAQTSLHKCTISPEPLQYIVCIQYNTVSVTWQDMKHTKDSEKRVQLDNKKKSCICACYRLVWALASTKFPKECKEHYSLLSTFLTSLFKKIHDIRVSLFSDYWGILYEIVTHSALTTLSSAICLYIILCCVSSWALLSTGIFK